MINKIFPCLWFDSKGKEAATFYCSIFKDSKIIETNPIVTALEIANQKIIFLDGGPLYQINPSISFYTAFKTFEELEYTWQKLIDGGSALMPLNNYPWSEKYGWLADKFGVNWQLTLEKSGEMDQKITPALMFTNEVNGKAKEAISFYTSIFENSKIKIEVPYTTEDSGETGNIKHSQFYLNNSLFIALDGGISYQFTFNEAISFVVECDNQQEIDFYWNHLTKDGKENRCGWLKDQYGVSWQVVPKILGSLMNDPQKAPKVAEAFMKMKKMDLQKIMDAAQ